ncbi:MAG: hypothetical protein N2557_08005 [Hydrogenophilus sp.]|nr:hypothetical protein [Hydrogenophilus sp.]
MKWFIQEVYRDIGKEGSLEQARRALRHALRELGDGFVILAQSQDHALHLAGGVMRELAEGAIPRLVPPILPRLELEARVRALKRGVREGDATAPSEMIRALTDLHLVIGAETTLNILRALLRGEEALEIGDEDEAEEQFREGLLFCPTAYESLERYRSFDELARGKDGGCFL